MKSLTLLITLSCSLNATAQNYLITFAGMGASETVGTVRVENLMKELTLNLNGSDILHLKGPVGIPLVENQQPGLRFCPNPVTGHTTFSVLPPFAGDAVISIREITGR